MRRAPNDGERIFDHAQAVFYVANVALERGDLDAGEAGYQEYYRLAQRLVALDPAKPEWRLELAYATSNLGQARCAAGAYDEAARYFEQSVAARRMLSEAAPGDVKMADAYAYALSWLAHNDLLRGHFRPAIKAINEQLAVYDGLLARDPDNHLTLDYMTTAQRRLGEAHLALGEIEEARRAAEKGRAIANRLLEREADHASWRLEAAFIEELFSTLAELEGKKEEAAAFANRAITIVQALFGRDRSDIDAHVALASALSRRVQIDWNKEERREAAASLRALFNELQRDFDQRLLVIIGETALTLARYEDEETGNAARALTYASAGVTQLAPHETALSVTARMRLAQLYFETGDIAQANRIASELELLGFRHPAFVLLKRQLFARAE